MAAERVQRESFMSPGGVPMHAGTQARDDEPKIDYDRVVWDLDYRRHVVDELNRFHEPAEGRRDDHAAL